MWYPLGPVYKPLLFFDLRCLFYFKKSNFCDKIWRSPQYHFQVEHSNWILPQLIPLQKSTIRLREAHLNLSYHCSKLSWYLKIRKRDQTWYNKLILCISWALWVFWYSILGTLVVHLLPWFWRQNLGISDVQSDAMWRLIYTQLFKTPWTH